MAEREAQLSVNFGADEESKLLYENLQKYRKSIGWSWKRVLLVGFAEIIANNKDNPDLIISIVDYLEK